MKLISLNLWGGKVYSPLMKFISREKADTDIFCFQEMFSTDREITTINGTRVNLFQEVCKLTTEFQHYFAPQDIGYEYEEPVQGVSYGLSNLIHNKIDLKNQGDIFVHGDGIA